MQTQAFCRNCFQAFRIEANEESATLICPICGVDLLADLKQEVDDLVRKCQEGAIRRSAQLPPLPREAMASLTRLWEEVRRSFILGEYSAALTLGCAFLEFVLERALKTDREMTLHPAIEAAKQAQLIDTSTADALFEMKRRVRNAYAHGDYDKIVGIQTKVTITQGHINQNEIATDEPVELKLSDLPRIQAIVKGRRDREFSRPVLQYIRMVANDLLSRVPELREASTTDGGDPARDQ